MTKQELYNQLVDLGRDYALPLLATFPMTKHATRADLERRCAWMEKAIELKPVNRELSRKIFQAAWTLGYLDPTIAQQAGLG